MPEGSGCHDVQALDAHHRHYHHLGMCGHELADGESRKHEVPPHPHSHPHPPPGGGAPSGWIASQCMARKGCVTEGCKPPHMLPF